ncbi:hypothetical protein [Nocardia sp. NPDC003726]
MSVKEDTTKTKSKRRSITPKASTEELMSEMNKVTGLSPSNLFNIAIDVLHFVWSVTRRGGVIGVKFPSDEDFRLVQMHIPGMTRPLDV